MSQEGTNGCCTYPRGYKCTIIWAIVLSSIGLVCAHTFGSNAARMTAIGSVVVICVMACVRQAKPLAIVGAVLSFLTSLVMLTGKVFYSNNPSVSNVWDVAQLIGCLIWIAPGVICCYLARKINLAHDSDTIAIAVPVDVDVDVDVEKK